MSRAPIYQLAKDLFLINILCAALVFMVVLLPDSPIRIALGAPFVLFFPGYTLISALFPEKNELDEFERTAFSIGLSLVVVPLTGLLLNYTPWGIKLPSILASIFLFIFSWSVVAIQRRARLPVTDRFSISLAFPWPGSTRANNSRNKIMWIGLIVGIVLIGGFGIYYASDLRRNEPFTEFYILGPEGKLANYPTNLTLGQNGTVILGVINQEQAEVTYDIVIKLENETMNRMSEIRIENDGKWQQDYTFCPTITGERLSLDFLLYKNGEAEAHRNLRLWIKVNSDE